MFGWNKIPQSLNQWKGIRKMFLWSSAVAEVLRCATSPPRAPSLCLNWHGQSTIQLHLRQAGLQGTAKGECPDESHSGPWLLHSLSASHFWLTSAWPWSSGFTQQGAPAALSLPAFLSPSDSLILHCFYWSFYYRWVKIPALLSRDSSTI